MDKPVKINEAEGIFVPLFDKNILDFDAISAEDAVISVAWDGCLLKSKEDRFSLEWNGIADLRGYTAVRMFLNCPMYISISAYAITDGKKEILFENICGDDFPIEPTGRISGRYITKIHADFNVLSERFNNHIINLSWIGTVDIDNEHIIEDSLKKYNRSSWNDYINYGAKPEGWEGVLFDAEELEDLKLRSKEPMFGKMVRDLYSKAGIISLRNPEEEIREYIPVAKHLYRYTRIRDRGREPYSYDIITLAIAGFLSGRSDWSELSARMIMCAVNTPKWFEGPQCCMKGSTFHHVCFMEEHYSYSISLAMMFLGNMFSDKGRKAIAKKLSEVWQTIDKCCSENGYRRFMNQGIVENAGALISACCMFSLGMDEYRIKIEDCYKRHSEIISHYINKEGHCTEGGDYFQYSFIRSAIMWIAYAHFIGKNVREVLPVNVRSTVKYLDCILVKDYKYGEFIPLNCARNVNFSNIMICFFDEFFNWENGKQIILSRLSDSNGAGEEAGIGIIIALKYLKNRSCTDAIVEKNDCDKAVIMEKSGLASYETENSKMWFAAERNPATGHFHNDRGSVILEAYGTNLLCDPGTTNYSNMMSKYMNSERYHNVAHPLDGRMNPSSYIAAVSSAEAGVGCRTVVTYEDFVHPSPHINFITKTNSGLTFSAELEELYSNNVIKAERSGTFCDRYLSLKDNWAFNDPQAIEINYISLGKWELYKNYAVCVVNRVKMRIDIFSDTGFKLQLDESMINYNNQKLYTLRIITDKAKKINVKSDIIYRNLKCDT